MTETLLLVVLIVVLFLITVISVVAMVRLRKKARIVNSENLDAGFEICINELNKLGSLIKSDLDAKYKEILFLYDLIEDKHKQIEVLVSKKDYEEPEPLKFLEPTDEMAVTSYNETESDYPRLIKPDHKIILQKSEQGLGVADIAKELGIGQGEVKLILNIASK